MFPSRRHFAHRGDASASIVTDPGRELLESLSRINTYNPPVHTCSTGWSFAGFYSGPTSIAYLFYRLSLIYPDTEFKQQSFRDWAVDYLKLGARAPAKKPDPSHCGIANELLSSLALRSVMSDDPNLAEQICAFERMINGNDEGSNEWLYGRAGYLYLLRLCRSHFQKQTGSQPIVLLLTQTIERTVQRVLDEPLPWTWHGKEYVGAAHGYIGTITQIVLSRTHSHSLGLGDIVEKLLALQFPSGNFPSSVKARYTEHDDRLVQFCHGGPGFAMSFNSIAAHFSVELQTRLQAAIEKARSDTWNRGLLTKPPCLCHGIAGNALAFTQEEDRRFEQMLAYSSTQSMEQNAKLDPSRGIEKGWLQDAGRDDAFAGLFTGEAGRAWVWAVADAKLPRTCLGYNDV